MIERRIASITAEDVQGLIDNEVSEDRTLEYKEDLPGGSDDEKMELLRDVSAFANAAGGDMLYGVAERRDSKGKPTGIPRGIVGLGAANIDAEIRRLDQIIRNGVEPRIPSIQIREINCGQAGSVLLLRIGDSWMRPHQVSLKARPRYFIRSSAGKQPLDYQEVREAFLQSAELPKRLRAFRDGRLATVLSGDLLYELAAEQVMVLHFLPLQSFRAGHEVNLHPAMEGRQPFPSGIGIGGFIRCNLDGVAFYNTGADMDRNMYGFTQLFHSGAIEIVDAYNLGTGDKEHLVYPIPLEESLQRAIEGAVACLKSFEVVGDVFLFVSMLNMAGFALYEQGAFYRGAPRKVDRNHLLFPEIQVDLEESAMVPFRKVCDMLWQAFGVRQSPSFDEDGSWRLQ